MLLLATDSQRYCCVPPRNRKIKGSLNVISVLHDAGPLPASGINPVLTHLSHPQPPALQDTILHRVLFHLPLNSCCFPGWSSVSPRQCGSWPPEHWLKTWPDVSAGREDWSGLRLSPPWHVHFLLGEVEQGQICSRSRAMCSTLSSHPLEEREVESITSAFLQGCTAASAGRGVAGAMFHRCASFRELKQRAVQQPDEPRFQIHDYIESQKKKTSCCSFM